MKRLTAFLLALSLALPGAWAFAQGTLEGPGELGRGATEGLLERDAVSDNDVWDDDWGNDRFGYFDEDFRWETMDGERERWNAWYGDSDLGWNDWYDDIADDELFEVGALRSGDLS